MRSYDKVSLRTEKDIPMRQRNIKTKSLQSVVYDQTALASSCLSTDRGQANGIARDCDWYHGFYMPYDRRSRCLSRRGMKGISCLVCGLYLLYYGFREFENDCKYPILPGSLILFVFVIWKRLNHL